jgi:hypothetical protein
MKQGTTRTELMAIPIVVGLFCIGLVLFVASVEGLWAWLFVGAAGLVLAAVLIARYAKTNPHPVAATPAPGPAAAAASGAGTADGPYRILVIADESCVDPAFAAGLAENADGRAVEALVIAPTLGSRLARWTGDESQYVDARKHLDETVAALAVAGITASGETGADDPLQAADDGVREFGPSEIVFVTRSGTQTDWAEQGVIETAKTRYAVAVSHVEIPAS